MTEEAKARWKKRLKVALTGIGCLLIPISPFYSTFVMQNLWNWFVAEAIHAAEISYWRAFGILVVLTVIRYNVENTYEKEMQAPRIYRMVETLLSPEARAELHKSFEVEDQSWSATIAGVNPQVGKTILNTVALAAGWGVHTFLI